MRKSSRSSTAVKKTRKVKNNIISGGCKRVIYLSRTYEGSRHDKAIIDLEGWKLPGGIILHDDTGFIGHEPEGVIIRRPFKKPKGKLLTKRQKQANRRMASKRVLVEHCIGRVKIYRIVKDQIRIWKNEARDLVMEICCAINNFKVTHGKN
jgi:hypothetical protein